MPCATVCSRSARSAASGAFGDGGTGDELGCEFTTMRTAGAGATAWSRAIPGAKAASISERTDAACSTVIPLRRGDLTILRSDLVGAGRTVHRRGRCNTICSMFVEREPASPEQAFDVGANEFCAIVVRAISSGR